MPNTPLSDRARSARLRAGFDNEAAAAQAIGCSRTLVISWENGSAKSIGGKYLLAAARAYQVRPEWLTDGSEKDGYPWGEKAAPPHHSQSVRLEPTMIAETHRALRELYRDEGRDYSIEADPARFVQLYEMRASMPVEPSQDDWVQFGRNISKIMGPQGAVTDGRNDGVPAESAGTKGMARRVRRKA
jgi:transcriptional regulator with XRE-family HTH domain